MSLKKTVVLVGMMGSGKTTVGKALAIALNVDFMDSDYEISVAANRSITEIFERDGDAFFRIAETQVIKRLLAEPPCVLSTGGGAFMSKENRALINDLGVSVFLNIDLEILWERVRYKESRPLLRTANPKITLSKIFEDRLSSYNLADISVTSIGNCSIADTTQRLLSALAERSDESNTLGRQL